MPYLQLKRIKLDACLQILSVTRKFENNNSNNNNDNNNRATLIPTSTKEGRIRVLGNSGTCQRTIGGTGNKQKSVEGKREQLVCFQGTGNTVKD